METIGLIIVCFCAISITANLISRLVAKEDRGLKRWNERQAMIESLRHEELRAEAIAMTNWQSVAHDYGVYSVDAPYQTANTASVPAQPQGQAWGAQLSPRSSSSPSPSSPSSSSSSPSSTPYPVAVTGSTSGHSRWRKDTEYKSQYACHTEEENLAIADKESVTYFEKLSKNLEVW